MRKILGELVAFLAACVFILDSPVALAQNVDLNDQTASAVGQEVTFTVSINTSPTPLQAYGFTVMFNPDILEFVASSPGALVQGAIFEVNTQMTGTGSIPAAGISITGPVDSEDPSQFNFQPIPQGTSGELLRLTFRVLSLQETTLTIENLVDDLAQGGWVPDSGQLGIGPVGMLDLDIDGNMASDALTDGLLILRFLFGFGGSTLINGVVAGNCTRCTATDIEAFLNSIR